MVSVKETTAERVSSAKWPRGETRASTPQAHVQESRLPPHGHSHLETKHGLVGYSA